jgi:nucleotide-binding universal stress UspA family protein
VANQVLRSSSIPVLLTKKKKGKPRFQKILVPTDFSEQEDIERNYAWKIAKPFDSELTLLYVLELHDYEFPPRILDEMFETVLKKLQTRKKREKEGIVIKEDVYRAVNASVGIVDYAETHKFDLIVLSTCVHTKLERFFLGSTTEKVISYSHIPIFAIPPAQCPKKKPTPGSNIGSRLTLSWGTSSFPLKKWLLSTHPRRIFLGIQPLCRPG